MKKLALLLAVLMILGSIDALASGRQYPRPKTGGQGCVNDASEFCDVWKTGDFACYTPKANYCFCKYYGNRCDQAQDAPDVADNNWTTT